MILELRQMCFVRDFTAFHPSVRVDEFASKWNSPRAFQRWDGCEVTATLTCDHKNRISSSLKFWEKPSRRSSYVAFTRTGDVRRTDQTDGPSKRAALPLATATASMVRKSGPKPGQIQEVVSGNYFVGRQTVDSPFWNWPPLKKDEHVPLRTNQYNNSRHYKPPVITQHYTVTLSTPLSLSDLHIAHFPPSPPLSDPDLPLGFKSYIFSEQLQIALASHSRCFVLL